MHSFTISTANLVASLPPARSLVVSTAAIATTTPAPADAIPGRSTTPRATGDTVKGTEGFSGGFCCMRRFSFMDVFILKKSRNDTVTGVFWCNATDLSDQMLAKVSARLFWLTK